MQLFVGLGNPGAQYQHNRHNVGFMAADAIARAHGFSPFRQKFGGLLAEGSIGGEKVLLLKPQTFMNRSGDSVKAVAQFYNAEHSEQLLDGQIDFVVDAIDNLTAKAHLLVRCLERGLRVVSCMGAAARLDPTQIRVDDLSNTTKDPFARALRKILQQQYAIDAVETRGARGPSCEPLHSIGVRYSPQKDRAQPVTATSTPSGMSMSTPVRLLRRASLICRYAVPSRTGSRRVGRRSSRRPVTEPEASRPSRGPAYTT